jgi:hypothetical protein
MAFLPVQLPPQQDQADVAESVALPTGQLRIVRASLGTTNPGGAGMTDVDPETVTTNDALLCGRCRSHMHLKATGRVPTTRGSESRRVRMHFVCPACGQEQEIVRPS